MRIRVRRFGVATKAGSPGLIPQNGIGASRTLVAGSEYPEGLSSLLAGYCFSSRCLRMLHVLSASAEILGRTKGT